MGGMVTVFDPQGNPGEIPEGQLAAAVKAGGMPAVHFKSPDGTDGYVPANRMQDALQAGGKLQPFEAQEVKHPGFWSTLTDDLTGIATGLYHAAVDPLTDTHQDLVNKLHQEQAADAAEESSPERNAHGALYRDVAVPAAKLVGVNVPGMEQSAAHGDVGGVMGHAAAVPVAMATTEAATGFAPKLSAALSEPAAATAERLRNITPKQAAQTAGAATGAGLGHGALSVPGAYYGAKGAGGIAESILGKERANAPILPRKTPFVDPGAPYPENPGELELHPVYPGASEPATPPAELLQARALSEGAQAAVDPAAGLRGIKQAAEPAAVYPGATQPATPSPELLQARSLSQGASVPPEPKSAALGKIKLSDLPPHAVHQAIQELGSKASIPDIASRALQLQQRLDEAVGAKPLQPGVPLKYQTAAGGKPMPGIPEGFTPVDSTALKGYKYDPDTREFESVTQGGQHYIHGDVSPEEAQSFADADSKGKAWQQIRNNPLVAKVVNGKRVATKPVQMPTEEAGVAPVVKPTPPPGFDDLTGILQKSLEAERAKARQ